ncbi:MAG: GNAT family N-acetyltransferase [Myxococcota bacterium]
MNADLLRSLDTDSRSVFSIRFPEFGQIDVRHFNVEDDAGFFHDWVTREYAVFWGLQNADLQAVRDEYRRLLAPEHYQVFVGMRAEQPVFVLESYDPHQDLIAEYYEPRAGDRGIHVIVAPPPPVPRQNFTWFMFRAILDFVFSDTEIQRVLVEPDVRNKKMFTICQRVGFELGQVVELPHKTAQLAFLVRERHDELARASEIKARTIMNRIDTTVSPQQAVTHLTAQRWSRANRQLIKKAICEFSHERLLRPREVEPTDVSGFSLYEVVVPEPRVGSSCDAVDAADAGGDKDAGSANHVADATGAVASSLTYRFRAKSLPLEHFAIDEDSIQCPKGEGPDAVEFIKRFREPLGITDAFLPLYLEEILSTLQGSAYKMAKGNPPASELAHADFQSIEQAMTEGHPCFVANNGRIGFDSADYRSYAPEAGNSFNLMWLAAHRRRAVYAGVDELGYDVLIDQELDAESRQRFESALRARELDPDEYMFMPIHPWQWFNKLASVFAAEVAAGDLVCLGYGADHYLAQQSVRTLFNVSNPEKFYVKSALSILNMGFMRGLPLYYLGTAPTMARWLEGLLYRDPYIKETGFRMLGEIASISYVNPHFEEFGPHNDYNKMLASLWRESPLSVMQNGQQAMTMAALLHIDDEGDALISKIVDASGLSDEEWLGRYLDAYLSPLLHCFYRYDLVFMPHGENIVLVLQDHVPVRALLKDITEEAAILSRDIELPEELKRMFMEVPESMKLLSIFIDVFDDFFRLLAAVLDAKNGFPAERFWACVADCVRRYQDRFPELEPKFERYDLFAPEFELSCLNRLQIANHRQMIDLDEPVGKLQLAGPIANPLARFGST